MQELLLCVASPLLPHALNLLAVGLRDQSVGCCKLRARGHMQFGTGDQTQ